MVSFNAQERLEIFLLACVGSLNSSVPRSSFQDKQSADKLLVRDRWLRSMDRLLLAYAANLRTKLGKRLAQIENEL